MITIYWMCDTCQGVGPYHYQFLKSTPIDITEAEVLAAIVHGQNEIRAVHAKGGCSGEVHFCQPLVTK